MPDEWHYSKGDQRLGPISTDELKAMASDGRLSPDDMIWKKGMPEWAPASSAKGLFPADAGPPPLPSSKSARPPYEVPPPLPEKSADQSPSRLRRSASRPPREAGSGLPPWAKGAGVAAVVVVVFLGFYVGRGGGGSSGQPSALSVQGYWANYDGELGRRLILAYLPGGRYRALMEIERGGKIISAESIAGRWALRGEAITMTTNKATSSFKIRMIGPDTMEQMQDDYFVQLERIPDEAGELKFSMAVNASAHRDSPLPPGVTDPDLWARVLRECPDLPLQTQITVYEGWKNAQIQQQRQRAIRRMYTP